MSVLSDNDWASDKVELFKEEGGAEEEEEEGEEEEETGEEVGREEVGREEAEGEGAEGIWGDEELRGFEEPQEDVKTIFGGNDSCEEELLDFSLGW